jgi:hypothetical protein
LLSDFFFPLQQQNGWVLEIGPQGNITSDIYNS